MIDDTEHDIPSESSKSLRNTPSIAASDDDATSDDDESRLVIYMDDREDDIDFVTLHNILYYLYTNCVNLRVGREEYRPNKTSHPPGYPDCPDPFNLYKSAKKFLLTSLSDYCFTYMKSSLTNFNVTRRLFRKDCELRDHEDLKDMFVEYLLANYEKVKVTERWRKVVLDEEEGIDSSARAFRKEMLLEIMEQLAYTPMAITAEV
jgi:hypothetical protein